MIYSMVRELAANARSPCRASPWFPKKPPNAFATGRNPENSVVAVTEGILRLLSPEELKGVLAHEIAHIANHDILIQTVAGVMASTIVSIANFMQFAAIFGMGRSSEDGEGGGSNPLMAIVLAILAPIAASLISSPSPARANTSPTPARRATAGSPSPSPPRSASSSHGTSAFPCRTATPPRRKCSSSPPLRRRHGQAVQHPPRHQRPHRPSPRNGGRQIKISGGQGHCPRPPGKTLWTALEMPVHSPEFTAPPPFTVHFLHVSKEDGFRIRRKPDAEPFLLIPEQSDTPLATNRKEYVSFPPLRLALKASILFNERERPPARPPRHPKGPRKKRRRGRGHFPFFRRVPLPAASIILDAGRIFQ